MVGKAVGWQIRPVVGAGAVATGAIGWYLLLLACWLMTVIVSWYWLVLDVWPLGAGSGAGYWLVLLACWLLLGSGAGLNHLVDNG